MTVKPKLKNKAKKPAEPVGRPSKFTPERCAAILKDISDRIPYIMAAESNGICEDTLYEWMAVGRRDSANNIDSAFARFSEDIKKAEANKMREHIEKVSNNVDRWQADAWMLERRWYKYFGANVQLNELNARLDKMEKDEANARKLHSAKDEKAESEKDES
jgi:hypothetical protein